MMPVHTLRENTFKRRLRDGGKQSGLWLTLESVNATEILSESGYDWMLLDAGVRTVMFPYVQSAAEARATVASTRYPPHGIRGGSGNMRANSYARVLDYATAYQQEQCVIAKRVLFKAGFDFIAVNSDTGILARQSEAILAQMKADE